ncbi:MAG TPA: adenylate/guanylate cyclase domain-containing protein [Rhodopila sp.]
MLDLKSWLDTWGLGKLEPLLVEQDISLEALPRLSEDDLSKLGLTIGLRLRLQNAIAAGLRPPDVAAAKPERRQLTILFSDLIASTELSGRLDPEEMRTVLQAYRGCCSAAVGRYGGHIAKFVGDGVLAYFCYPQAHEDDAERAVRAALDIAQTVPGTRPLPDLILGVRLGIATGRVVVGGMIGTDEAAQIEVVGDTPNLAARLQSVAPANGIVVAASTQRLTDGLFEYSNLGVLELKGFPVPVAAWLVHGESTVESRFTASHKRIVGATVGRVDELEVLKEQWDRAANGEGRVALVSGEPGIGKSRLLLALREALEPSRPYVMTLYCSPYHQASALHPVINHYERLAGIVHQDPAETKLRKLEQSLLQRGADLADAVPLIATLLSVPLGDHYPPLALTPQELKERVLALLIRRVRELSEERPVLCLVEDVHWIDPTTAELISRAIVSLAKARVLVVVTGRPPIDALRLPDDTPVVPLPLARLGRADAIRLLQQFDDGRRLASEVVLEIIARADGVPLYLEELAKAVVESRVPDAHRRRSRHTSFGAIVPASLHDSLMGRLDRMSQCKPVAQLAAVLGRIFTKQLLLAAAPSHWQHIDAAVDALAAAQIILPLPSGPQPAFQFKHALLQDVAYQSLLKATRREYHSRVARALERGFPDLADAQPEVVASHFTEAELPEKAIEYWLKAGRRATRTSSNLEATIHFERGLALLEEIDNPDQRARLEYGLYLGLLAPLIAVKGYASAELEHAITRAIHLGEELGDVEELFPALYSRQAFEIVTGRIDQALVHAEEAVALARRGPPSETGIFAGQMIGAIKLFLGDPGAALEPLRHMLAIYDSERHRTTAHHFGRDIFVACSSYLCLAMWHLGHVDQAREHGRRAIAYARSLDHTNTLGLALNFAGVCLAGLARDLVLLQSAATELLALGKAHGLPVWTAVATGFAGKLLVERGELSAGIRQIQAGMDTLFALKVILLRPILCGWLAEAYAAQGEVAKGLAVLQQGHEAARGGEHWMDAELHRIQGELLQIGLTADHEAAERNLRQALAIARAQVSRSLELRAANSLARLWIRQGRTSEALHLLKSVTQWFKGHADTTDLSESATIVRKIQQNCAEDAGR